jgi:hypothetical protein
MARADGQVDMETTLLTIVVRWGEAVLHVAHLAPADTFVVGESARLPWGYALPAVVLGAQQAPLVRVDRARGEAFLVVLPRATGTIEEKGRPAVSLGGVPGAREIRMPLGSRATVEIGEIAFDVRFADEGWPGDRWAARGRWRAPMRRALVPAAFTMALHAALLVGAARAMPPLGEVDEALDSSETDLTPTMLINSDEHELETLENDRPRLDGDDREVAYSKCGDDGSSMGRPTAPDDRYAYGRGDTLAPAMPWGRYHGSLGNDDASAMGNMSGDHIGESFGLPGVRFGQRTLCPMCGGYGRGPRLRVPTEGGGATTTEGSARGPGRL